MNTTEAPASSLTKTSACRAGASGDGGPAASRRNGPQLWPPKQIAEPEGLSFGGHPASNIENPESTPAPPSSIQAPPSLSCPSRRRKPRGKIAELPPPQRDLINQLLDGGSTYKKIALKMAELGVKLNAENIS